MTGKVALLSQILGKLIYRRIHFPSWESLYHKDSSTYRLLNKVNPRSAFVPGWVTKYEYPVLNKLLFFFIPFWRRYLRLQNSQSCVMLFLLFLSTVCSSFPLGPCRHSRILIYDIVLKIAERVVRILLNSLDFSSSKAITSISLLSVVLLKPCCHRYNPSYDIPH